MKARGRSLVELLRASLVEKDMFLLLNRLIEDMDGFPMMSKSKDAKYDPIILFLVTQSSNDECQKHLRGARKVLNLKVKDFDFWMSAFWLRQGEELSRQRAYAALRLICCWGG
ncbi:hypothetical protein EJB05_50903, partial [Eragrostis curvula]